MKPISTQRTANHLISWAAVVEARLLKAGATIDRTPNGVWRIKLGDANLVVGDLRHLTEHKLCRLGA